jgi:hypothetical protein
MKIFKTIVLASVLLLPTGCAHISKALADVLPTVEAKAGGEGIGLSVESDLGVKLFCIKTDGKVAGILGKIPVLGSVIVEVVGTCPVEEVPAPEAVEPA